MRAWGRDHERETFQTKVSLWKAAADSGPNPRYPFGHEHAGKTMELVLITMHLENENGRQIGHFEIRPEYSPVDIVKDIFDTAQDHARTTGNFGSRVALFYFGDSKRHHHELGVATYPEDSDGFSAGSAQFRSRDLTTRSGQEAAAAQVFVQGATRVMEVAAQQTSTFMQGAGVLLSEQRQMLAESNSENRALRAENATLRANQENVKNQELERMIKLQNAEIVMMFKKLGVEHLFAVVPGVMSTLYRKLGSKLGLDNSPMEERIFKIADMIFHTPKKMEAVMEGMEPAEQQALITLVQEAQKQREMKLYFERGKGMAGGVSRPLALAQWVDKFGTKKPEPPKAEPEPQAKAS